MDGHLHAGTELPPSRTTILGSFLRGRPRNSSQSHIQLSTDVHHPLLDPPPSPPQQPPSPPLQTPTRRRQGVPTSLMTNNNNNNNTTQSGLGITSMLRRRRSAGNVSVQVPPPQIITASATAAAALSLGTSSNRPTQPPAGATTTALTPATTANHNVSHRIRLVPHLDTRRSLRFDAISRDLKEGDPSLRIGRFTDRSGMGLAAVNALGSNKLAFRSKVVSRAHAEIWVESGGRFFVKDTKSSSGTFLNHVRLSLANTESRPFQIKDGDILQLGVDYQGGAEDIYKSVKIKIEVGREWQASANAFNTNALKNLKTLALPASNGKKAVTTIKLPAHGKSQIPDCCICLFSVTIRQALFIAPCSHTFHYKCIRPLLESHHPAFSCPLCRTFADLEEDVEVEIEYEEAELDEIEGAFDKDVVIEAEADIDIDVEASDDQGPMLSHCRHHHQPHDGVSDEMLCSRSNSGMGLRAVEREAGAETEVEGDGSGPGVVSRLRARRGAPGGGSGSGSGDRASPLADLTDGPDEEMVIDISQSASGGEVGVGGVVAVGGDADEVMDMDGTVGTGKRKR